MILHRDPIIEWAAVWSYIAVAIAFGIGPSLVRGVVADKSIKAWKSAIIAIAIFASVTPIVVWAALVHLTYAGVAGGSLGSNPAAAQYVVLLGIVVGALASWVLLLPGWGLKVYGRLLAYWFGRVAADKGTWTQYQGSVRDDWGADRWDSIMNGVG